jgi:hypothetical protein
MRKWIFLAFLALAAIALTVSMGVFLQPHSQSASKTQVETTTPKAEISDSQTSQSDNAAIASEKPINAPQIDPQTLLGHIQALNFRRYTTAERDRTRQYLTKSLKTWGWKPKLQRFGKGVNVIATRKGTNPEAGTVLVAAHYDTVAVSPGADDNGSGVAVILEAARLFASHPTPRTLQLVFFDEEELGLRGSLAFTASKANLKQLQDVIVMDMVGYACYTPGCQKYPEGLPVTLPTDKGDFLAVVGDAEHLSLLEAFKKSAQPGLPSVLTLPVPFKGALTPDVLRSDHAPFWYHGIGAVLVSDTANLRTPHYHQPTDTPATLDHPFFQGSAQIIINAITLLLEHPNH